MKESLFKKRNNSEYQTFAGEGAFVFLLSALFLMLPLALLINSSTLEFLKANNAAAAVLSAEHRTPKKVLWKVDPHLETLIERRIATWKADTLPGSARRPMDNISRWVSKVSAYREYIRDAAEKYGVDETFLVALFAWESGGDPKARSIKHARGFGQFVKVTAAEKGLVVNKVVDERLDPVKSIDAAASYIRDAARRYKRYRFLVTAYYNYGPGNVRKKIRKHGLNESLFYKLPKETKTHYTNIYAIKRLIDESERYGFSYKVRPCHKESIKNSRLYVVKRGEDLQAIARKKGVDMKMILWKNPKIISPKRVTSGTVIKI